MFYQEGEGVLRLAQDEPLDDDPFGVLDFYPNAKYVTYTVTVPESRVRFRVQNTGNTALVNPNVKLTFQNIMVIGNNFDGQTVKFTNHVRGIGLYTGAQWQGTTIAAGDFTEFLVDFSSSPILDQPASITLTLVAENFAGKTVSVPVELIA